MKLYRLFCYSDGKAIYATRAENQEQGLIEARKQACFNNSGFIYPMSYIPFDIYERYKNNHSENWLYRAPAWLAHQEFLTKRRETASID